MPRTFTRSLRTFLHKIQTKFVMKWSTNCWLTTFLARTPHVASERNRQGLSACRMNQARALQLEHCVLQLALHTTQVQRA